MKLKRAEYYREFVKKSIPQFNLVMSAVASEIADATVNGFTAATIDLKVLVEVFDVNIADNKISTLRNLIVKELGEKGFSFKCEPEQIIRIFW